MQSPRQYRRQSNHQPWKPLSHYLGCASSGGRDGSGIGLPAAFCSFDPRADCLFKLEESVQPGFTKGGATRQIRGYRDEASVFIAPENIGRIASRNVSHLSALPIETEPARHLAGIAEPNILRILRIAAKSLARLLMN
jgi:hypothetical protein